MKRKLFLTSVLIFGLSLSHINAQTIPNTTTANTTKPQRQVKPQAAPLKKISVQTPLKRRAYPTTSVVDTVKNTDFSLNGQYQFLLSRSRSINGYKLVNPYRLTAVWKSVTDTLTKERSELVKTRAKLSEQEKTIRTLQTEIKGNKSEVNDANAKLDEISFLGLSFTKGTYNMIVWSIIVVLAIALFIVIARSAKNVLEARHRTQLYDEISNEYQAYKTKANEQQRKLARELQDERNIVEELKSKGR